MYHLLQHDTFEKQSRGEKVQTERKNLKRVYDKSEPPSAEKNSYQHGSESFSSPEKWEYFMSADEMRLQIKETQDFVLFFGAVQSMAVD